MRRQDVLIVGSGAREHALAWKLRRSPDLGRLLVAPGNAGTATIAENVPVAATDIAALVRLVEREGVDLTVVGPEAPLALGLADRLRAGGHAVVGPDQAAARIEASKAFAKRVMERAGVPTAAYAAFDGIDDALAYIAGSDYPLVVKADGLAAGKGVVVCPDRAAAERCLVAFMRERALGAAGEVVIVEEALEGPEVSVLALVDGDTVVPLPPAQDHKRLRNGDQGPNTGGMGAYAPLPWFGPDRCARVAEEILGPVALTLCDMGAPFQGILYAGLMLTADGPRVLEFNCRLGDPEAQVILPLLGGDLLPWLLSVAHGELRRAPRAIELTGQTAVGVTLAAPGYPEGTRIGDSISGLDAVPDGVLVFHAGTATNDRGETVTAGGRVLTVVGLGDSPQEARQRAYSAPIHFSDFQMRTDIPRAARRRARIGVLASGDGSNLQALLDATAVGQAASRSQAIDAEVAVVISEWEGARSLQRARAHGVPALALPYRGRRQDRVAREAYDRRLLDHLRPFQLDLLVLAGWNLVLSPGFVRTCPCPVINVHPALLEEDGRDTLEIDGQVIPVLRGLRAVRQALALGLPITGVTVHQVTDAVDVGPVVRREIVPINGDDCEESLYSRIKAVEHRLLVGSVRTVLAQA